MHVIVCTRAGMRKKREGEVGYMQGEMDLCAWMGLRAWA